MTRESIRKFVTTVLMAMMLLPANVVFAQRKTSQPRGASTASAPAKAQSCQGGWRGVVRLRKTLNESFSSDEPGIRKATDRIKHVDSRNYSYTGTAIVNSSDPMKPEVTAKVAFTDQDNKWGEERVFDTCNSRESGHWFIIEGTDNRFTEAKAEGSASSFNLTVDEMAGTYSLSLKLPDAIGSFKREEHVKRSGHCQAKNNAPYDRSTNEQTKVDGESLSAYDKFDPKHPDEITGSKTWGDDGKGQVRSFVYTATWRFTRCPQQLLVTDLRFEHMKFPTWDNYEEIVEQVGTIDGNLVKVKANVVNMSSETKFAEITFKETYKGDKWDGARPDHPLHESVSIRLGPNEEREVEVLWNTQGFAWFDDGRPRYLQRVKVEAWEEFKKKDEMTKNLKISPKPLVIVPGIWSNPQTIELYQNLLTLSHSYGWKAERATMMGKSVYDRADDLARYVDKVQRDNNAWHVDMVAHSTGGLVARLFAHKQEVRPDNYPTVKHLILLGTPNLGTPCAGSIKSMDNFKSYWKTAEELEPEEIARFNQFVTQRKGTRFSALIGNASSMLCGHIETGDGFTGVESAKFGLADFAFTNSDHPDLLEPTHFGEFIKPHLVTGPRGTYPLPVALGNGGIDGRASGF